MQKKILSVKKVTASIGKSSPPQILASAKGQVTSAGWKNGILVPYVYIQPPKDGIQDFDFLADTPEETSSNVITEISGKNDYFVKEEWIKGVRVHASENSLVAMLNAPLSTK